MDVSINFTRNQIDKMMIKRMHATTCDADSLCVNPVTTIWRSSNDILSFFCQQHSDIAR